MFSLKILYCFRLFSYSYGSTMEACLSQLGNCLQKYNKFQYHTHFLTKYCVKKLLFLLDYKEIKFRWYYSGA